jgi:2-oxoglutarate dehydrogenase E1 component
VLPLLQVQLLVRAYQVRGHHIAKLDPLGINDVDLADHNPAELELNYYGWTEKDLDKEFTLGPGILPRYAETGKDKMTLREIVGELKKMYCE